MSEFTFTITNNTFSENSERQEENNVDVVVTDAIVSSNNNTTTTSIDEHNNRQGNNTERRSELLLVPSPEQLRHQQEQEQQEQLQLQLKLQQQQQLFEEEDDDIPEIGIIETAEDDDIPEIIEPEMLGEDDNEIGDRRQPSQQQQQQEQEQQQQQQQQRPQFQQRIQAERQERKQRPYNHIPTSKQRRTASAQQGAAASPRAEPRQQQQNEDANNPEMVALVHKLLNRIRTLESQVSELQRVIIHNWNKSSDSQGTMVSPQLTGKSAENKIHVLQTTSLAEDDCFKSLRNLELGSGTGTASSPQGRQQRNRPRANTVDGKPELIEIDEADDNDAALDDEIIGLGSDEDDICSVRIPPFLMKNLKPHQIRGVEFLWQHMVNDSGCILADFMGLGKTLQVISLIFLYLNANEGASVLILCPASVIKHWEVEFQRVNAWIEKFKDRYFTPIYPSSFEKGYTINQRYNVLDEWHTLGGVMIMSYDMYRSFHTQCYTELCSPGPSIVILDEGHKIKHMEAGISQALHKVATSRRIVLTGYPLQNNLIEYWTMINFINSGYLGTLADFRFKFAKPIQTGQKHNASINKQKIARRRAWLLFDKVSSFVLRRDSSLLKDSLPKKQEIVISIRLSPVQLQLYKNFLSLMDQEYYYGHTCAFWVYDVFTMLCNHPHILKRYVEAREKQQQQLDKQTQQVGLCGDMSSNPKRTSRRYFASKTFMAVMGGGNLNNNNSNDATAAEEADDEDKVRENEEEVAEKLAEMEKNALIAFQRTLATLHEAEKSHTLGGKLDILLDIIYHCKQINDKVVVFSKSLDSLDFLEDTFKAINEKAVLNNQPEKQINHLRFDGSTAMEERQKYINQFNDPKDDNALNVFLISTLAGCEGINIQGANRVVLLDVNWNPSHDAEACCRVYRYGQTKPVYIYRLVTQGTMEEMIYQRQVNKEVLSKWVVDDFSAPIYGDANQREKWFKEPEVIPFNEEDPYEVDAAIDDSILSAIIEKQKKWVTKVHLHDMLFTESPELSDLLTEEERIQAYGEEEWDSVYEKRHSNRGSRKRASTGSTQISSSMGSPLMRAAVAAMTARPSRPSLDSIKPSATARGKSTVSAEATKKGSRGANNATTTTAACNKPVTTLSSLASIDEMDLTDETAAGGAAGDTMPELSLSGPADQQQTATSSTTPTKLKSKRSPTDSLSSVLSAFPKNIIAAATSATITPNSSVKFSPLSSPSADPTTSGASQQQQQQQPLSANHPRYAKEMDKMKERLARNAPTRRPKQQPQATTVAPSTTSAAAAATSTTSNDVVIMSNHTTTISSPPTKRQQQQQQQQQQQSNNSNESSSADTSNSISSSDSDQRPPWQRDRDRYSSSSSGSSRYSSSYGTYYESGGGNNDSYYRNYSRRDDYHSHYHHHHYNNSTTSSTTTSSSSSSSSSSRQYQQYNHQAQQSDTSSDYCYNPHHHQQQQQQHKLLNSTASYSYAAPANVPTFVIPPTPQPPTAAPTGCPYPQQTQQQQQQVPQLPPSPQTIATTATAAMPPPPSQNQPSSQFDFSKDRIWTTTTTTTTPATTSESTTDSSSSNSENYNNSTRRRSSISGSSGNSSSGSRGSSSSRSRGRNNSNDSSNNDHNDYYSSSSSINDSDNNKRVTRSSSESYLLREKKRKQQQQQQQQADHRGSERQQYNGNGNSNKKRRR